MTGKQQTLLQRSLTLRELGEGVQVLFLHISPSRDWESAAGTL